MSHGYSTTLRNARMDAITTAIGNAGKLQIYDGTKPATGAAVTTQTKLAELTLGSPFAPGADDGVLTPNAVTQDSAADATGTASWCRVLKADDTFVIDGDVGTTGKFLNLNTTSIVAGGPVAITSWEMTEGNA
jgi:hypothetical protein